MSIEVRFNGNLLATLGPQQAETHILKTGTKITYSGDTYRELQLSSENTPTEDYSLYFKKEQDILIGGIPVDCGNLFSKTGRNVLIPNEVNIRVK